MRSSSSSSGSEEDFDMGGHSSLKSAEQRRAAMPRLSLLDVPAVLREFRSNGINEAHAYKIWSYILKKGESRVSSIPGIPKAAIRLLEERFALPVSKVLQEKTSSDGSSTKMLVDLFDGKRVECVVMRYGAVKLDKFPEEEAAKKAAESEDREDHGALKRRNFRCNPRATVCVSSQVGCAMGCVFCATGSMGLLASLTAGEILEQVYFAGRLESVRNVVFMGMGEPLQNYEEVRAAVQLMTDVRGFNLAAHRVTISTVGVVRGLRRLADDMPEVSLALSLHAATQQTRTRIVPSARSYKLRDIMAACRHFAEVKRRGAKSRHCTVFFEYVLIHDVNGTARHAEQLATLLAPEKDWALLNVIPYNPTLSGAAVDLRAPTQNEIDVFVAIVRDAGVLTTVRQTLGQDIDSACGQLVVQQQQEQRKRVEENQRAERQAGDDQLAEDEGWAEDEQQTKGVAEFADEHEETSQGEDADEKLLAAAASTASPIWWWRSTPTTVALVAAAATAALVAGCCVLKRRRHY